MCMDISIRIAEIDAQIAQLQQEKMRLINIELINNPYAELKAMAPKKFGEWSELYICKQCPSFDRRNQKGWDLWSDVLGRVEVKSSRVPNNSGVTFNQCHPYDCDYFLFVIYNTEEATEQLFLVPSSDFNKFEASPQHTRNDREHAECFNMLASAKKRMAILEHYRVNGWEELEKIAGGK